MQIIYNIFSAIWIGICIYKIHKLTIIMKIMEKSTYLNVLSSFALLSILTEKNIITEEELNNEFIKYNGKKS